MESGIITLKFREEKSISLVNEISLRFSVFGRVLHVHWLLLAFLKDDLINIFKSFFFLDWVMIQKSMAAFLQM